MGKKVIVYTPKQWRDRERESLRKTWFFIKGFAIFFVIILIIFFIFNPQRPSAQKSQDKEEPIYYYDKICEDLCNGVKNNKENPEIKYSGNYKKKNALEFICDCGIVEIYSLIDDKTKQITLKVMDK